MGRASCAVPHDGVHAVLALEPLQLHLAPISERELPGALDEFFQQRRHEYLAALGLAGDAPRQVHVLPEEVVAFLDRLAGVQADTDAYGLDITLRRRTI